MQMNEIPLDTLVTVRVKGEAKRLTRVRLTRDLNDKNKVVVKNGRRGRPRHLSADQISTINVLADQDS